MLDQSLIKSNFVGRDGFIWWIGQIAPAENQDDQINKNGWGNRYKVRILGYDSPNVSELSNDNIRWAQVLLSPTDGSGAANYGTNPKLRPGDTVFGFFLDGSPDYNLPVILAVFGRTSEVSTQEYSKPFAPFTGFTSRVDNDGSKLKPDQTNEQTIKSQKSPYHLPPSVANRINEISYSGAIRNSVYLATNKPGSKINKIQTELENAIKFLENIKSYPNLAQEWIDEQVDNLCEEISKKIEGITNDIVSGVVNDTYEKLQDPLKQGAEAVYDNVNSTVTAASGSKSAGHLAGAKAQEATIKPVQELQKLIPCLISNIIKGLAGLIKDMVCALLKNVANVVSCVIDQFIGGLLNGIIDLIISGMSAVLGGLSLLLSFSNFNLGETIRQSAEGLLGIPFSLNCDEEPEEEGVEKWTIGSGPEQSSSFNINDILSVANAANAIATDPASALSGLASIAGPLDFLSPNISIPDVEGVLSNCYAGPPVACLPPTINIFGGGGSGASALPIFGSVVGDTASIIGAVITSGGSGYTYPPFVSIKDNCGKGYGGVAKSVIRNGEVVSITISSEGEGYTRGETQDVSIASVYIENPGFNYQKDDIGVDNFGNEYELVISDGSIIYATPPINIKEITDLPVIKIVSKFKSKSSGSGAKLNPVFGFKEEIQKAQGLSGRQREVKQVIDCIT
jgi:hypothetical protein